MSWILLLQSEYRRIKKGFYALATTQPMILLAVVALAIGAIALAVRAGETLFIISFIPGGLSGITVFVLLVGLISGFAITLILPKATYFDEQFRSVPIRDIETYVGLRALPLVIMAVVIAIPPMLMLWRIYTLVGVETSTFWVIVASILFVAVALQGSACSEALRGHRSWILLFVGTLGIVGSIVVSLLLPMNSHTSWAWLATYLPQASLSQGEFSLALPTVYAALVGAVVSLFLSASAWTIYSFRPDPPFRRRRLRPVFPIGRDLSTWP